MTLDFIYLPGISSIGTQLDGDTQQAFDEISAEIAAIHEGRTDATNRMKALHEAVTKAQARYDRDNHRAFYDGDPSLTAESGKALADAKAELQRGMQEIVIPLKRRELALRNRLDREWYPLLSAMRQTERDEADKALNAAKAKVQAKILKAFDVGLPMSADPILHPLVQLINAHPAVVYATQRYRIAFDASQGNDDARENRQALNALTQQVGG